MFSDWTQMDPAIMSTSVSLGKAAGGPALSPQQAELFARFNQLGVEGRPGWARLGWGGVGYAGVSLPPGFAPAKPAQRPAECIDAK